MMGDVLEEVADYVGGHCDHLNVIANRADEVFRSKIC